MGNYLNRAIELGRATMKRGLLHIIISSSLVKLVSFISAMFLPNFLSKADYGLLTYVDNIRNYIMLFNAIGISNATLKYCALDRPREKLKGYFLVTLIVGIIFDVILVVLTIGAFLFVPLQFEGSRVLFLLMSLLPVLAFLLEDIQLLLRASFNNQKYSILSFTYSALMVATQIGLAVLAGLNGVVLARYASVIICVILGLIFIKNIDLMKSKAIMPDKQEIKQMVWFGIVMMAANATSLIMQLNETFIIGQVMKDQEAIADYKVASYILTVSLFLLQSVVIFVYPYFVKHISDKKWIWSKFKKLFFINAAIMIPMHIVLILITGFIVNLIYGDKYMNVVPIMQMLLVASLGQTVFRGLTGNILAGIGQEKFNLWLNVIFAVIHVVVDYWAISNYGLKGAAIALTLVYYLSGIIMVFRLRKVCKTDS